MRVVDGEHALGADDADFQAVHRARPDHRQRPGDAGVIEAAVLEDDGSGRGVDSLAQRAERLVDRARVELDRLLRLHHPHDDVERVRARDDHRRDLRRIRGALVVVERDQPVHERARADQRHLAEAAGAHLLLRHEPAAAKALRIADDGIDFCFLELLLELSRDSARSVASGFSMSSEMPLSAGGEDRLDVQVLVGGDDRCGDLRPLQQFPEVRGDEIGARLALDELEPVLAAGPPAR